MWQSFLVHNEFPLSTCVYCRNVENRGCHCNLPGFGFCCGFRDDQSLRNECSRVPGRSLIGLTGLFRTEPHRQQKEFGNGRRIATLHTDNRSFAEIEKQDLF